MSRSILALFAVLGVWLVLFVVGPRPWKWAYKRYKPRHQRRRRR